MTRIFTRADALAQGYTDSELRHFCRTGVYTRLHRGLYAKATELEGSSAEDRHVLVARAMMQSSTAQDSVLSHASAAAVHGIDLWNVELGVVHVTRNRRTGARSDHRRRVHSCPYDRDEVTEVDGLRVTTVSRTIADLACTLPLEEAVCAADHAARMFGVTGQDVEEILSRRPNRSGHARALRVSRIMDPASESVGESRSRVVLLDAGFSPKIQHVIRCGTRIYRVDFYLEEFNVIGEFDGRVKYGALVPLGDTPADVLWREKQREDDLRRAGYGIARWTWPDLYSPGTITGRIRDAAALNRTPPL